MVPSACVWLDRRIRRGQSLYQRAIEGAVRSHDPFQFIAGTWLIRRLSPDANPIEIADLPKKRDEETLLHAMGTEAANVHVGSPRQVKIERPNRIVWDLDPGPDVMWKQVVQTAGLVRAVLKTLELTS